MTDIEKVARALCDDAGCVWDHDPQTLSRDADAAQCLVAVNAEDGAEQRAAAVIRDYGDKRYQQAIADVVEWLREERLSDTADHYAQLITRRFGKDA